MIGNKIVRDPGFDDISHSATPNWTKPKANQIAELIEDHKSKINNLENTYINDQPVEMFYSSQAQINEANSESTISPDPMSRK